MPGGQVVRMERQDGRWSLWGRAGGPQPVGTPAGPLGTFDAVVMCDAMTANRGTHPAAQALKPTGCDRAPVGQGLIASCQLLSACSLPRPAVRSGCRYEFRRCAGAWSFGWFGPSGLLRALTWCALEVQGHRASWKSRRRVGESRSCGS